MVTLTCLIIVTIMLYKSLKGDRTMGRKQSSCGILFDLIMTVITGGLWLIWVLIRFLRTH